MPIYEYECPKCGRFEAVQKVSEKPLKANPDCTDKKCPCAAKRLISAAAFHLKGSGWYKTDYKSSSSGASSTSAGGTSSDTGSDSSGDAKDTKDKKEKKSLKTVGGKCGSGCGCH